MTFRVLYPVGSTFAAPNPNNPDAEPEEDFTDEDAYAFFPGGVLGIWSSKEGRSYYLPDGRWHMVSANKGHQPGMQTVSGIKSHAYELLTPPNG